MSDKSAETLLKAAKDAMRNAHAPYSKFHVGAALEAVNGKVYTGCNVENASYGGTICAARVAMGAAVAAGEREFRRIAIASDAADPIPPCGLCRQFMAEFGVKLEVLSVGAGGRRATWILGDLLPMAFTGADLEGRRGGAKA